MIDLSFLDVITLEKEEPQQIMDIIKKAVVNIFLSCSKNALRKHAYSYYLKDLKIMTNAKDFNILFF